MSKITARLFCWRDEIEKIPMGDLAHPFVLQRVAAVPHAALCGDCALLVHGAHPSQRATSFWEPASLAA